MQQRPPARSRLATCAALVVAVAACLVPASPAAAAETWPVDDHATISLDGRGNGHGHGMSQYGAQGAALEGLGYLQILDFYYPGTHRGTATGKVKVLITADTGRAVVVQHRPRLTVRSLGTGKRFKLTDRAARKPITRWRITPGPGSRSTVSYRTRAWHRLRAVRGDAEFSAGGQPIRLYTGSGSVEYRGILRSASPTGAGQDRDTVNILSLENYLKGVVPSEVIASVWEPDAIRAQAVAARTYAAYERAHAPSSRHYQLCDTAHCQVYGGYSAEYSRSNDAVAKTAHRVLTSGGEPAFAQFSASNGGWTAAGAFDYLPAQEDPYDGWTDQGHQSWSATVTSEEIERAYNLENLTSISIETRDGNGQWGGRAETVRLTSATGWTGTVTGESFRSHLGLRSTWFEITSVDPQ